MANALSTLGAGFGFGDASKIYGKKPKIPAFPGLEAAQTAAVAANLKTFPEASQLSSQVNTYNQGELSRMLDLALPGGREKINQTITSLLAGQLPKDVADTVARSAAERSMAGGFGGSQAAGNLTARDLGLASLDLTQSGFDAAQRWLEQSTAPTLDVTNMFISPEQRYAADVGKFDRDLMAAKVAAAPDPSARGMFDSTMELIGMVLSAYGGGSGYKNTYKGDMGGGGGGGGGGSSTWTFGGNGYGFGTTKSTGGSRKWFLGGNPGKG